MQESDVEYVQDQLALINEQVGKPLNFSIYHDGFPVAAKGHTISEALVLKLAQLDPRRIRFSRDEITGRLAEDDLQSLLDDEIRPKSRELALDAGVVEDLSEEVRSMATRKVKEVFESCRYLTKLDLEATAELAAELIRRAARLDASAFKLRDLRNHDEYTYFHSVNVCVLATALFRDYVKDEKELLDIGIGMLLHDIGKSKIDLKILNKQGRLTDNEYNVMCRHVVYGHNLVKTNKDVPDVAKNIILNHHERLNGTGYSRGLNENQLSVFDMVASICDVFDAITTSRVYRAKQDVHKAVAILIHGSGTHFQAKILNHFLRGIGRFPVGTFVVLNNGEIGVVSRVNSSAISLPEIRVIFNETGSKLDKPRTIDLHEHSGLYIEKTLDTAMPAFEVSMLNNAAES